MLPENFGGLNLIKNNLYFNIPIIKSRYRFKNPL